MNPRDVTLVVPKSATHRPLDQILADRAKAEAEIVVINARLTNYNEEIKRLAEAANAALATTE